VRATQGCPAAGWPDEHVSERDEVAPACVDALGIGWGPDTENDLEHAEGVIGAADAAQAIRDAAAGLEPTVRAATGADAACDLSIETVDHDFYWSCWLDGAGQRIGLRACTGHAQANTNHHQRSFIVAPRYWLQIRARVPMVRQLSEPGSGRNVAHVAVLR
jgi:hypothetical protein